MSLTEHIPLPDPARGPVKARPRIDRETHDLYQSGFADFIIVGEVHDAVADAAVAELNTRMAVARKLGA
jgi:hypothetical protein